jgi:hypothetical protein
VWFGSQLDEKHLFEWAVEIPGVLRWEQDTLVVRSRISQASLYDLLALFSRYKIPMRQLAQFESAANSAWFRDPGKYWNKQVFGALQSNRTIDTDAQRRPRAARAPVGRRSSPR